MSLGYDWTSGAKLRFDCLGKAGLSMLLKKSVLSPFNLLFPLSLFSFLLMPVDFFLCFENVLELFVRYLAS